MKVLIDTTHNNNTYTFIDITEVEMGAIQFALGLTAQEVDDEECRKLVQKIEDVTNERPQS
jgi:hypothetical protein